MELACQRRRPSCSSHLTKSFFSPQESDGFGGGGVVLPGGDSLGNCALDRPVSSLLDLVRSLHSLSSELPVSSALLFFPLFLSQGCYWCGQANATGLCVENFPSLSSDCPLLILTASFCGSDGASLTPPLFETERTKKGLAAIVTAIVVMLLLMLLSCVTFMFCPNRCGSSPLWCCPFPKAFRSF